MNKYIEEFRKHIEESYVNAGSVYADFGEILCYEIHSQPINPRMRAKTLNNGFETGLTFKELARKWGISITLLGEIIADHCRKLENENNPQNKSPQPKKGQNKG